MNVPWIYLVLKTQAALPLAGARLALDLPHAWPANDSGVGQHSAYIPSWGGLR